MSEQILLQGKLLGTEGFLVSRPGTDEDFATRALWIALISEILPRALLAELELAPLLLGSSGGGQFLVVLPDTARAAADDFLATSAVFGGALTLGILLFRRLMVLPAFAVNPPWLERLHQPDSGVPYWIAPGAVDTLGFPAATRLRPAGR